MEGSIKYSHICPLSGRMRLCAQSNPCGGLPESGTLLIPDASKCIREALMVTGWESCAARHRLVRASRAIALLPSWKA